MLTFSQARGSTCTSLLRVFESLVFIFHVSPPRALCSASAGEINAPELADSIEAAREFILAEQENAAAAAEEERQQQQRDAAAGKRRAVPPGLAYVVLLLENTISSAL